MCQILIVAIIVFLCACTSCGAFRFTVPGGMSPHGDFDHLILNCEALMPESVDTTTSCYSSCTQNSNDENILCNLQADSYLYKLALKSPNFKQSNPGTRGCPQGQSRFLCTSVPSDAQDCDNTKAGSMKEGDVCYTKCGATFCPTGLLAEGKRFRDIIRKEDLKVSNCQFGSYRMRCAVQVQSKSSLPVPYNNNSNTLSALHGASIE